MGLPFLLLTSRDDEIVAADERAAIPRLAGLSADETVWWRMEREPLPDDLDVEEWSGIIVCGSPFDVSTPQEDKSAVQVRVESDLDRLYDRVLERGAPLLGMCYGLGTLARHLGGVVDGTHAEEISAADLRVTTQGRMDPVLAGVPDVFQAYVGHHEAVTRFAFGATLLVTSSAAPIQMARVGRAVYVTQFHPELDLGGIEVRIREYADRGYFPAEERSRVEDAVRSADVSSAHLILSNFVRLFRR